ncbi:hypothetical protein RTCIAT899_PC04535 (plasmid) [Rhizobium tropici CIAT 899]|nr:hypothetical protein RTCIAT899_PC04535 [Rhizobium tropici CIAT 899]
MASTAELAIRRGSRRASSMPLRNFLEQLPIFSASGGRKRKLFLK